MRPSSINGCNRLELSCRIVRDCPSDALLWTDGSGCAAVAILRFLLPSVFRLFQGNFMKTWLSVARRLGVAGLLALSFGGLQAQTQPPMPTDDELRNASMRAT